MAVISPVIVPPSYHIDCGQPHIHCHVLYDTMCTRLPPYFGGCCVRMARHARSVPNPPYSCERYLSFYARRITLEIIPLIIFMHAFKLISVSKVFRVVPGELVASGHPGRSLGQHVQCDWLLMGSQPGGDRA